MKKLTLNLFVILVFFTFLPGCNTLISPSSSPAASKRLQYEAMLSDPLIKKDFRALKKIAMEAHIYKKNGKDYFSNNDIKLLDAQSDVIVRRFQLHYHLTSSKYKIHTYIARNKYDSCYQYYNSLNKNSVGQTCQEFLSRFGSCQLCDRFIKALRTRNKPIIHAHWWGGEETAALVDTFKLSNGDSVYLGFEFSK